MHYVSAEGLSKSYGIQPLFQNIQFNIEEGDKIALVARNGVGKSTLLRILTGQETPDHGKLWIHKDVQVALLEQEPGFEEDKTILENIFHDHHPVIQTIKAYEAALESGEELAIADALVKMDADSAWDFEAKVRQILARLNIHHLTSPVKDLSGGQRKRIALARILIDTGFRNRHCLLLLDEPTNHLDLEMIEWLEQYLGQEKISLLLVSHDRYFLDATCSELWELEKDRLYVYKGDYETYLEQKALRLDNEQSSIDKAKNTYRKELEWMRKQPKARTTKSKSRQDNFYQVEAAAKKKTVDQQLQLEVKMSRLGGKVAELKKVYKAHGDQVILKGFDYTFAKGERIGIVGKNGVGKSTFLNVLQGLEPADSGKINIGETVVFGNFSQKGLAFKDNVRVIEYVKSFAEHFPLADGTYLSAAQFLELFLFSPDKQFTYLNNLSGGEKKRLQLLVVLFRNPNFLILDEPTNDLDLPTLGVLEQFLQTYPGCVLLVSHDRYFMDRIVDHLFVLEGQGQIRDFPGNYTQYRLQQKAEEQAVKQSPSVTPPAPVVPNPPKAKPVGFKEKREWEMLEKEIPKLEAAKAEWAAQLSSGTLDYTAIQSISEKLVHITQELEEKEMRWLELSELIGN